MLRVFQNSYQSLIAVVRVVHVQPNGSEYTVFPLCTVINPLTGLMK